MSCNGCSTATTGAPAGCKSNGGCSSGSCNRMNVYDWLADVPLSFNEQAFDIVEVTFNNGARKGFYRNFKKLDLTTGDTVVVQAAQGYDIGHVNLQGELVKLQMKKRRVRERDDTIRNIQRIAGSSDREQLGKVRGKERQLLVTSRVIARELNLDMKIGDVEFQGDGKKATFYYTAEGRVDFRELVKRYAKEFKIKIEMRQIGSRQEAGRIGGLGSCGRELCCSTWLSDFKSVSTAAARYQNLAINTDKLSGQCGRLKCCLNYELDTYVDALKVFPKRADKLDTAEGRAFLRKTEIFKQLMYYVYDGSTTIHKLDVEDVKKILHMNKKGEKPASLLDFAIKPEEEEKELPIDDLVGQVSLRSLEKHGRKRQKRRRNRNRSNRKR